MILAALLSIMTATWVYVVKYLYVHRNLFTPDRLSYPIDTKPGHTEERFCHSNKVKDRPKLANIYRSRKLNSLSKRCYFNGSRWHNNAENRVVGHKNVADNSWKVRSCSANATMKIMSTFISRNNWLEELIDRLCISIISIALYRSGLLATDGDYLCSSMFTNPFYIGLKLPMQQIR